MKKNNLSPEGIPKPLLQTWFDIIRSNEAEQSAKDAAAEKLMTVFGSLENAAAFYKNNFAQ